MHHPTDKTVYIMAFGTSVVERWRERDVAADLHRKNERNEEKRGNFLFHARARTHTFVITIGALLLMALNVHIKTSDLI